MASEFDTGPLSWVKPEVDLALQAAGTALAAYGAGGDAGQLRQARNHLHQAHGALAMVGIDGLAQLGESLEALLRAMEEGGAAPAVLATAERARQAIQHYLDALLAGQPHQPLRLAPVYLDLAACRGVAAHPADLFFPALDGRPPRREAPPALSAEARQARLKGERAHYQKGLLTWLKKPDQASEAIAQLRGAVAAIEALQETPAARSFWWIALAFFDALNEPAIAADPRARQLCSHIDGQIRRLLEGLGSVPDRLLRDALYFIAQAPATGSEQLAAVHAVHALADLLPPAEAASTAATADEPALAALREGLAEAEGLWNKFCAGSGTALNALAGRAGEFARDCAALGNTDLKRLGQGFASLAHWLAEDPARKTPAQARELGTALFLLHAVLDHYPDTGPAFATRVDAMVDRLHAALAGRPLADPLPELEDLARRAEEKLVIGQATRDILARLTLVEQALDGYFRAPAGGLSLASVDAPLREVAAKLAMLGHLSAVTAVKSCLARTADLLAGEQPPAPAACEALARDLALIGFFAEALPEGASDFQQFIRRWDQPASQAPEPAAAETPVETAPAAVAAEPAAPGLDEEFAEVPAGPAEIPAPSAETLMLAAASGEIIDAELLAIFLEEAREVLATLATQRECLRSTPHDAEALTTVRRATHTLKGSGRMVGLRDLGETAWELEQTYNLWLREERVPTAELLALIEDEHRLFAAWVDQLAAASGLAPDPQALIARARQLRDETEAVDPRLSATAAALEELLGAVPSVPAAPPEPPAAPPPEADNASAPALNPALASLFRDEAQGHLATLAAASADLVARPDSEAPFAATRAAHTLGGIAAAVGFSALARLARALENTLLRHNAAPLREAAATVCMQAAVDRLQRLLEAGLAGLPESPVDDLCAALATCYAGIAAADLDAAMAAAGEGEAVSPSEELAASVSPPAVDRPLPGAELTPLPELSAAAVLGDELDAQLLPVFLDEAAEQLPALGDCLRQWRQQPGDSALPRAMARLLHTFKGNARMAGAMQLGEATHQLENRVELAALAGPASPAALDLIEAGIDQLAQAVEYLRQPPAPVTAAAPAVDAAAAESSAPEAGPPVLRVRAELVDRLINEAGEVAIARSRAESELAVARRGLADLTDNVARLREQLREIEIQAESRIQSHVAPLAGSGSEFDPLELDRFTRFQELTRFLAESVNDVATVQQGLSRQLETIGGTLLAQGRLTRSLQQGLMGVRMLPFASLADRLHRVVRQTAKATGKRASLDIVGGEVEVDRAILDQMLAPLEHMLRNAVTHGIEAPDRRAAAGKPEIGEITLRVAQEGEEIVIHLADDGAGLDLARIRARAEAGGLLAPGEAVSEEHLGEFIFQPGFSTAASLTQEAGRGVGMDVVKTAAVAVGGRVEVSSTPGQGTRFSLCLPVTLAVMAAVLVEAGGRSYAIPAGMIESSRPVTAAELAEGLARGVTDAEGQRCAVHALATLLGEPGRPPVDGASTPLLHLRAGHQRLALAVDAQSAAQEIVVKPVGPQIARLPGVDGATVLGNGQIVLIVNPVALAGQARRPAPLATAGGVAVPVAPCVLVVDDSLTVRKISSRLLEREGYRVVLAKDGEEGLAQLGHSRPAVILSDIEMPRMDGFEFLRRVRENAATRDLPVIMITSRTAEKHRSHALALGANHYLGKPYDEAQLLQLVAGYCADGEKT